jgi:ABC-2 type transport system permease protein
VDNRLAGLNLLRWRAGLYLHLIRARVRAQLQYRLSFALDLAGTCFITFVDFLAIVVLFAHLPRLAGWSLPEVAFFYAMATFSFGITDLLIGHLDEFPRSIRTGAFDLLLVRPVGSLFQVVASDLALRRIGKMIQATAILLYALGRLHIDWTPGRVAMLIAMIPTGVAIYSGVWIAAMSVTFWAVEAREVSNAFTYGGSLLATYPINIFGGWTRRLLAFVIPMAFVSYFPGLFVLGHPDPLGSPVLLQYITPLLAAALLLLSTRVWLIGVRHYRSTGS